jgi:hypothetical protein
LILLVPLRRVLAGREPRGAAGFFVLSGKTLISLGRNGDTRMVRLEFTRARQILPSSSLPCDRGDVTNLPREGWHSPNSSGERRTGGWMGASSVLQIKLKLNERFEEDFSKIIIEMIGTRLACIYYQSFIHDV